MTLKLACLPLALILAGCITVGPQYRPPAPDTPAQWKNAVSPPPANVAVDLAHWWQSLDDPILDRLIETALKQNLDLKSTQAKLRQARAKARIADAALYPSLSGSANAKRSESGNDANPSKSFSMGLDASWELDIFGANRKASEGAMATISAQEATLGDTQVSLVAEVANTYVSLRTLQARHAVAQTNLASQQETRDLTRWRWQAGLASELDFIQAESTLAQTRAKLPALDAELENTRNQLAVLLGLQPAALASLLDDNGKLPDYNRVAAIALPLDTLRQRPDIRAAERNLAAQAAEINIAEAARYPTLNLSGTVSLQSGQLGQLLRADSLVNSLAAGLSAPIFNAGRIRANIDVQNAVYEQLLASYEKTVLQALADMENALTALATTDIRRQELLTASQAAEAADGMARQRYASGLVDYATVLETQRTLLSVQDSLKSVEGERIKALIQLYKALGGGWSATDISVAQHNQAGEARHD